MESKRESDIYMSEQSEKMIWKKNFRVDVGRYVESSPNHYAVTKMVRICMKKQIRYCITPQIKGKLIKTQQLCWRICTDKDSNQTHIFWKCEIIMLFWDSIQLSICKRLGTRYPEIVW